MPERVDGLAAEDFALVQDGVAFNETIEPGRIVGLAGLDGHGQDAFLECLAGLRAPGRGQINKIGPSGRMTITSLKGAARRGILYLPRERRTMGIFPNLSVLDNFGIASLARDLRGGLLSARSRRRRYEPFRERLSIVGDNADLPVTSLSGGNQQKALLARLLARDPDVLLLNDPTRGVDIATRRVLYRLFRELANEGMALVVLSSEVEEAVELCDRVLVFREQSLFARLDGAQKTPERLIAAMFGRAA
jgi:ribose transport system ATP-binding protein